MMSQNDPLDVLEAAGETAQKAFMTRRRWLQAGTASALGAVGYGYYYTQQPYRPTLRFDGRYAYAGPELPPVIHAVVQYANEIQGRPYAKGGGHQFLFDHAFDCSGAISHVLYRAGLLTGPLTSEDFAKFGQPGPGHYVTLFVKPGAHVFMAVCGLRFDTSGGKDNEGPRWRASARDASDFKTRHPMSL